VLLVNPVTVAQFRPVLLKQLSKRAIQIGIVRKKTSVCVFDEAAILSKPLDRVGVLGLVSAWYDTCHLVPVQRREFEPRFVFEMDERIVQPYAIDRLDSLPYRYSRNIRAVPINCLTQFGEDMFLLIVSVSSYSVSSRSPFPYFRMLYYDLKDGPAHPQG
jgi:hypothetical protein